jgi:hypothetical protein
VGQASSRQRQHQRFDPRHAPLPLAHDLGLEAPVTISRYRHLDRADLSDHRLRSPPVAAVAAVATFGGVAVVAEMLAHLDFQRGFQHLLGQPTEQAARTDQTHPLRPALLDQPTSQLLVDHRNIRRSLLR